MKDQSRIMREIGFELDEYVIWDRQRDYNNMKTLGYPYVYRFNRVTNLFVFISNEGSAFKGSES